MANKKTNKSANAGTLSERLNASATRAKKRKDLKKQFDQVTDELTAEVDAVIQELSQNPTIENINQFFEVFSGIEPSDESKHILKDIIKRKVRERNVLRCDDYRAYFTATSRNDRKVVTLQVRNAEENRMTKSSTQIPDGLVFFPR